ncbi:MAG: hypothetical protein AAFR70_01475 [Pseudomonadota bacterium]
MGRAGQTHMFLKWAANGQRPLHTHARTRRHRAAALVVTACLSVLTATTAIAREVPPPIRTSPTNQVPTCVTPERLTAFMKTRNRRLIKRFNRIAWWYQKHGNDWSVRWDYAFFQMLLETNFLSYRRPNGKWGDVNPRQNNFAGLGTTGGGVPGDSYPNVSTGVLAQIQHLVVYSGERIPRPVGPRTRLKQDVILKLSAPVAARRPVTFQDLSGRWAVDKKYGRSMAWVATLFAKRYCPGGLKQPARSARRSAPARSPTQVTAPAQQRQRAAAAVPSLRPITSGCRVVMASFGGTQTVLIKDVAAGQTTLTALDVDPAQADAMTDGFIAQYAKGGKPIATYKSRAEALSEAFRLCPSAAAPRSQG